MVEMYAMLDMSLATIFLGSFPGAFYRPGSGQSPICNKTVFEFLCLSCSLDVNEAYTVRVSLPSF